MSTQDKLLKSLEILRKYTTSNHVSDFSQKKEKTQHIHVVTEAISNPTIQISPSFHNLLTSTIEILLVLCNDSESDIRMIAEESLNRIIRALNDSNIGKIQIELHKEIKRNGNSRTLRAALTRFAQLAHKIRPHKGKPYVINLFPSLVKIAERSEEQIQEALTNSLPKIISVLGSFTSDYHIKNLLKPFLNNIFSLSASTRRAAVSCIQTICINCGRPSFFITYCLNNALDKILPLNGNVSSQLILGLMNIFKGLIPFLFNLRAIEEQNDICGNVQIEKVEYITVEKFLEIYELCLHHLTDKDHNVINASLETLNTLIENLPKNIQSILLNPNGINKSRIYNTMSKLKSPSTLSIATNVTSGEDSILLESELTDSITTDVEKWIDESKLAVMHLPSTRSADNIEKSQFLDDTMVNISFSELDISGQSICDSIDSTNPYIKSQSLGNEFEKSETISENSSEKSFSDMCEDVPKEITKDVDIGSFTDSGVPLLYCARLISKLFLLTGTSGSCMTDRISRVSVKSTALTSLSSICRVYPTFLIKYLDKNYNQEVNVKSASDQGMFDILFLTEHPDPQLRGNTRILLGNFIKQVVIEHGSCYNSWLRKIGSLNAYAALSFEKWTKYFVEGLHDESFNCSKQTLVSLTTCLKYVLESNQGKSVGDILKLLPLLAKNPYWLVKVSLCELVCSLPYITIYFITGNSIFQNHVLHNILYELLYDSDQRVRSASANAIVRIVPNLYYEEFSSENTVTAKAIRYRNLLLSNLYDMQSDINVDKLKFIENTPFPFNKIGENLNPEIEFILSKIVAKLYSSILTSDSKYFTNGCIETLTLLSNAYPCTLYKSAWFCGTTSSNGRGEHDQTTDSCDLLNLCVDLITKTNLPYDITLHIDLLTLSSSLYSGYSLSLLKPVTDIENESKFWNMFSLEKHGSLSETFLTYLMKLLNIFHYVLDDLAPISLHSKTVLPNLPAAASHLSPMKRRKSDLEKRTANSVKNADEKIDKRETLKHNLMGTFLHCTHMMKIYELLRTAYNNYKTSLDNSACENFLNLLKSCLNSLLVIMEVGTITEFGRIAEEILNYLNSTFNIHSAATVECVQQLLRALFGTNTTSNAAEIIGDTNKKFEEECIEVNGFYNNMLQKPYNEISMCINSLRNINKIEYDGDITLMGYLHRKNVKKSLTGSKGLDKVLTNYIRNFEPMVIKSLKQYTITSNVLFQCKVLQLLHQLVQLKINYCLLDSDQIFIGFVLKQFEYIEKGQIQHAHLLIPRIFQFLVQLSYSRQHSKSIIGVPKILQLCDGLMASEQPPLIYCIPALKPVVEDIFLIRNKLSAFDMKELETTREVVLSMLLKLCEYHQVIELIILILDDSKYSSDVEKWERWSRQVLNVLFPMLKHGRFKLDNVTPFILLRKLIFTLNPKVFNPIDEFVIMLFQQPPSQSDDIIVFKRWLGKIIILLIILSATKEEVLIYKISKLKHNFIPSSIFENVTITPDPLNVTNTADYFQNLSSEMLFVKFIFRTIDISSEKCSEIASFELKDFFIEELSMFLMFCVHNFQSGFHNKIANAVILDIKEDGHSNLLGIDKINYNFYRTSLFFPTLTFQWTFFLTLINYHDHSFWSRILQIFEHCAKKTVPVCESTNFQIVKIGGTIVYCDFLSENSHNSKDISWILTNGVNTLINLFNEPPVYEFLSSVHRNPADGQVFLDMVLEKSVAIKDPVFRSKLLKSVENIHPSQTGILVKLLLPKMLQVRELTLARLAVKMASRKIEFLLTLPVEDVKNQLSKEDLVKIVNFFKEHSMQSKYEVLLGVLNKLSVQFYGLPPLRIDQRRVVDPDNTRNLQTDKSWFVTQIKTKFRNHRRGKEFAEMLNNLDFEELSALMASEGFNKSILMDCIKFGVTLVRSDNVKLESDLLKVSRNCLLQEVIRVVNSLPSLLYVNNDCNIDEILTYHSKVFMEKVETTDFLNSLSHIIPAMSYFVHSLPYVPLYKVSRFEYIVNFGVICLELITYLINHDKQNINIQIIECALKCAKSIFLHKEFLSIMSSEHHIVWAYLAVHSLYSFVNIFLLGEEEGPLPIVINYLLSQNSNMASNNIICEACGELSSLIYWMYKINCRNIDLPSFLIEHVRHITISLSRLHVFNSFLLIPIKVWDTGWEPDLAGPFYTQVPPLPIELLEERDILEEYIFRITLLGWTSRQQFEETWMCMLSVLCSATSEDIPSEQFNVAEHASSVAMKTITTLLIQTLRYPLPGRKEYELLCVPRNATIPCEKISLKKLRKIQFNMQMTHKNLVQTNTENKLESIFTNNNLEKNGDYFSFGQLSIKYFLIACHLIEDVDEKSCASVTHMKREEMLDESGLDINSCLQFLVDFYNHFLEPHAKPSLKILHETVRSVITISELFNNRSQFKWMLNSFLELLKIHAVEDELIHQYLIIGICKAAAVVNPEIEVFENIKKYVVQFLRSPFVPSRSACLHGLLYLVEGSKLNNIKLGGIADELQLILPCAVEYIQTHLNPSHSEYNKFEQHTLLVWSLAFYIMENVDESHVEANFVTNTLNIAISVLSQQKASLVIHNAMMKGIERIIIVRKDLCEKFGTQIVKLALEHMKRDNPSNSLIGFQLLLTYMYTAYSEQIEQKHFTQILQSNPENLVRTIEKISAIFEYIKKGYPYEIEVVCSVLPAILDDFFTSADILTKVIGEFLSAQQPHPMLLSKVVFHLFQCAIEQDQLILLQDWVVFCLPNFTQNFSVGMATWCLTCFFVSASPNKWLRSFFPYIQTRIQRYEYEDRKMFCIAGSDFYKNLTTQKQKETFIANLEHIKDQPDMPFNNLLYSLEKK